MVCRNCGADLKPGIKYCLECGNYIDEDEYSVSDYEIGTMSGGGRNYELTDEVVNPRPEVSRQRVAAARKRRKSFIKPVDILIYAGLSLIIIVSIIVIIATLIGGGDEKVPEPTVPVGDVVINLNSYEITLPRALNYDIQGSILFVSDGVNYTFSYKNTTDDYNSYANDTNRLQAELVANNYEVLNIEKKVVNQREFVLCQIKVNGRTKYLYLTPLDNATTMGVIEVYENASWENALGVIADINNKIVKDGASFNSYSNTGTADQNQTTQQQTTQQSQQPEQPQQVPPEQVQPQQPNTIVPQQALPPS